MKESDTPETDWFTSGFSKTMHRSHKGKSKRADHVWHGKFNDWEDKYLEKKEEHRNVENPEDDSNG